jgi:hypothetical protein
MFSLTNAVESEGEAMMGVQFKIAEPHLPRETVV